MLFVASLLLIGTAEGQRFFGGYYPTQQRGSYFGNVYTGRSAWSTRSYYSPQSHYRFPMARHGLPYLPFRNPATTGAVATTTPEAAVDATEAPEAAEAVEPAVEPAEEETSGKKKKKKTTDSGRNNRLGGGGFGSGIGLPSTEAPTEVVTPTPAPTETPTPEPTEAPTPGLLCYHRTI